MARYSNPRTAGDAIADFEYRFGGLAYFDDNTACIAAEDNGPACY